MSIPTVGVVVVNYNGGELTIDCLRSLVHTDWPAAKLRVVGAGLAALASIGGAWAWHRHHHNGHNGHH